MPSVENLSIRQHLRRWPAHWCGGAGQPGLVEAQRSPQPRAPATGKLISGLCLILGYLILGLVSARAIPSLGLNIPFWPPSGLAIALVLVEGLVLLPAVTAGALLTNLQLIGGQLGPALLIALAHTAATAIVVLLARDRKSTRLNSSHSQQSRMPSSA